MMLQRTKAKLIYIASNLAVAVAASGHAWFIIRMFNGLKWNTVEFHAAQWIPLLLGAVGFGSVGYWIGRYRTWHSAYGILGRCLVPFMVAATVYVVTLEMLQ